MRPAPDVTVGWWRLDREDRLLGFSTLESSGDSIEKIVFSTSPISTLTRSSSRLPFNELMLSNLNLIGTTPTHWNQGSKNRPSSIRLDRFVTYSGLTKSVPLPDTRQRVDRLKLDKTRWTRPSSRDDSINSMKIG